MNYYIKVKDFKGFVRAINKLNELTEYILSPYTNTLLDLQANRELYVATDEAVKMIFSSPSLRGLKERVGDLKELKFPKILRYNNGLFCKSN